MPTPKWPKSVPVLEEGDIGEDYEFYDDNPEHPCCLLGWAKHVFSDDNAYCHAIMELDTSVVNHEGDVEGDCGIERIANFNDGAWPRERANVWNAAMLRLGYTEVYDVD